MRRAKRATTWFPFSGQLLTTHPVVAMLPSPRGKKKRETVEGGTTLEGVHCVSVPGLLRGRDEGRRRTDGVGAASPWAPLRRPQQRPNRDARGEFGKERFSRGANEMLLFPNEWPLFAV